MNNNLANSCCASLSLFPPLTSPVTTPPSPPSHCVFITIKEAPGSPRHAATLLRSPIADIGHARIGNLAGVDAGFPRPWVREGGHTHTDYIRVAVRTNGRFFSSPDDLPVAAEPFVALEEVR